MQTAQKNDWLQVNEYYAVGDVPSKVNTIEDTINDIHNSISNVSDDLTTMSSSINYNSNRLDNIVDRLTTFAHDIKEIHRTLCLISMYNIFITIACSVSCILITLLYNDLDSNTASGSESNYSIETCSNSVESTASESSIIPTEYSSSQEFDIQTSSEVNSSIETSSEVNSSIESSDHVVGSHNIGEALDVPEISTHVKFCTDYRAYNIEYTPHYRLQQLAWTDSYGLRRYNDDYLVALGSYYSTSIGDRFLVTLDTGKSFTVMLADGKWDIDCDVDNMYTPTIDYNGNKAGNLLEFIIDKYAVSDEMYEYGSLDYYEEFKGSVASMIYLGRDKSADWDSYE